MTPKTSPPKRKIRGEFWSIPAISALLLTSGCVISTDDPSKVSGDETSESPEGAPQTPDGEDGEALASSISTSTNIGADLQVDVYALEMIDDEFLRLSLGITNNSDSPFNLGYGLARTNSPLSASEVSLIDGVNQQRYLSYSHSDGTCFCNSLNGPIDSGSTEALWVLYPAPPEGLEEMTVATPLTPPLMDIPIRDSSESLENDDLADPEIIDLITISDDLENQTGRTESGEEVSIILSSDVLFETNSSELNNEAQEILEQVAQEIDDASSSTISIDGYADNTGNDSINIPLSKERADIVESELGDLITRGGISFESDGHGSADPIASNDSEEGRERNRRVTVTFEK